MVVGNNTGNVTETAVQNGRRSLAPNRYTVALFSQCVLQQVAFHSNHMTRQSMILIGILVCLLTCGCTKQPKPKMAVKEPIGADSSASMPKPERKSVGIDGTDIPTIYQLGKHDHFYVYPNYVVRVGRSMNVDQSIEVYRRTTANDQQMLKRTETDSCWLAVITYSNYFHGIGGHYLFVDAGTAPEPRTYFIYDLETRQCCDTIFYSSPVSFSEDHFLTYFASTDIKPTKENCPEIDKWAERDFDVEIQEERILDLNSLTMKLTGKRRCMPLQ